MLNDNLRRLAEQLVAIGIVERLTIAAPRLLGLFPANSLDDVRLRRTIGEQPLRLKGGLALLATQLVPTHQAFGVFAGDVGALQSRWFRFAGRNEQHVAVAEQRLGADAVKDGAAVDLRRDAERDAARKVCLDQAGDDIHTRAL